MDDQNQTDLGQVSKSKYWKFVAGFLTIVILSIVALLGLSKYERYLSSKQVNKMANALQQLEKQDYDAAMADTVGGKTPQETLSMYIAAVEKGDYSLASKYFIGSKQEQELKSFEKAPKENLITYIAVLKEVITRGGEYSFDRKEFSFDGDILVRMKLYPNGIWKIIEMF
ncbi:MAG: hypothetical protein WCV80_00910 [Candidatus Paceibacterota bacterium]|jgi:hypothetical protein